MDIDMDALIAMDEKAIGEIGFEEAFASLEAVVALLESGDLALDRSIALYESGVLLSRRCGEALEAAELRVREVDEEGGVGGAVDL